MPTIICDENASLAADLETHFNSDAFGYYGQPNNFMDIQRTNFVMPVQVKIKRNNVTHIKSDDFPGNDATQTILDSFTPEQTKTLTSAFNMVIPHITSIRG